MNSSTAILRISVQNFLATLPHLTLSEQCPPWPPPNTSAVINIRMLCLRHKDKTYRYHLMTWQRTRLRSASKTRANRCDEKSRRTRWVHQLNSLEFHSCKSFTA